MVLAPVSPDAADRRERRPRGGLLTERRKAQGAIIQNKLAGAMASVRVAVI
jgi:hypothetical protein